MCSFHKWQNVYIVCLGYIICLVLLIHYILLQLPSKAVYFHFAFVTRQQRVINQIFCLSVAYHYTHCFSLIGKLPSFSYHAYYEMVSYLAGTVKNRKLLFCFSVIVIWFCSSLFYLTLLSNVMLFLCMMLVSGTEAGMRHFQLKYTFQSQPLGKQISSWFS